MTRRIRILLGISALSFAILPFVLVFWLVATQSGLLQVARLLGDASDNRIQLGDIGGTLLGPITIGEFRIVSDAAQIEIRQLHLAWSPAELLRRRVHVTQIAAGEIAVGVVPHTSPTTASTLPELRLPFALQIDQARVATLDWRTIDQSAPQTLHDIAISGSWEDSGITVTQAQVRERPGSVVNAQGHIDPRGAYPLNLELQWQWPLTRDRIVAGAGTLAGDVGRLAVQQTLAQPGTATLNATVENALDQPRWTAQLALPSTLMQHWVAQAPAAEIEMTLDASGDEKRVELHGDVLLTREQLSVRSKLNARWSDQRLIIDKSQLHWPGLDAPLTVSGQVKTVTPFTADVALKWSDVNGTLAQSWQIAKHSGDLTLTGTADGYTLALLSDGLINTEKAHVALRGHGHQHGIVVDEAKIALGSRGLQGNGRFDWTPAIDYDAYLNWTGIDWPLREPYLFSRRGSAHITGDRAHAVFGSQLAFRAPYVPEGEWRVGGAATPEHITITHLDGQTRGGHASAQGTITLQPNVRIQADVNGDQIDLAQWLKHVPSKLVVRGSIDGTLAVNTDPSWLFHVEDAHGALRGQPVQARGDVALRERQWTLNPVIVQSDNAHAVAQGRIGIDSDLAWSVVIPALERFDPQWHGQFDTQGSFNGDVMQPELRGWIHANHVRIADIAAERIEAEADIDFQPDSTRNSTLQFRAERLSGNDLHVDAIEAGLAGTRRDHGFAVHIRGPDGTLTVGATAALDDAGWNATIADLRLDTREFGDWSNDAPGHVRWTMQDVTLATWCLSGNDGQVCAGATHQLDGAWQTRINAPHIALELLQPWLPGTAKIKGAVSVAAALQRDPSHPITGSVALVANDGTIRLEIPEREPTLLNYENVMLTGKLLDNAMTLSASGNVIDTGEVTLSAELPPLPWQQPWRSTALTAHAQATMHRFDWITGIDPNMQQPRGFLQVDITGGGTLGDPTIDGAATLSDASLTIGASGTHVADLNATAYATGDQRIAFNARGKLGDGALSAAGDYSWDNDLHRLVASLHGDRARIVDVPDVQVDISPDLQFSITPELATVNGTVAIPHADVVIKGGVRTVTPSPDVVIVDAPVVKQPASTLKLSSIVRFDLGEDVRFEGFGLRARLQGSVAVMDTPDRITSGIGELRIASGQYEPPLLLDWLAGPKLAVKDGRLVFVGGPIDDPGLNLRASRKIGEVEAGFNVSGTLHEPQVAVYSIPGMSDTDALSYVLLGRPARQNTAQENSQLSSTSASLTIAGSEFLADTLRRPLGVEEVTVEQDVEGRTSLQLGRYLSPKLYVSYGVGLAEHINTLRMRYQLSKIWSIEAETGASFSAADLLYTLETD